MPATTKGKKEKEEDEAYCAGKAGRVKKEKDPNAPKRPMCAYFLFMNDRRLTLKNDHPKALMGEQTKIMTSEWKALSEK